MISIDDFKKIEIKIGHIINAEEIDGSDKLFKLAVDVGEESPRQIVSGIKNYFSTPQDVIGKKCAFVTNLEPRVIMGLESQGMIMAVSGQVGENNFFSLLETMKDVPAGSVVK